MVYTVSQISNEIKTILGTNIPDKLTVEGEISNFKVSNGNLFFTLKDEESSISIVSWSFEKYFDIEGITNGDKVQVYGKLVCYSKNGSYSLQIFKLEKQGVGDLHSAYEKLKYKFNLKGYFDDKNKKQLPNNIKNIGIITSPEGAALQDILFVLKKNKFQGKVYIKRCMVQGNMCPKSIADSIEYLNNFKIQEGKTKKKLDLIMVTRGGGSFEDLMGYSDEKVIESIYESDIFVMSAVGHEVDFMLSDFVADCRAPTPSIGAEIISKKQKDILDNLNEINEFFSQTLKTKILHSFEIYYNKLNMLQIKNKSPEEILSNKIRDLDILEDIFEKYLEKIIANYYIKINNLEKDLEKYNMEKANEFGMVQIYIKNNNNYEICNSIKFLESKKEKIFKLVFDDGIAEFTVKKIDIKTSNE
jgi:exodeoxyribonuclease VII large subunit